MQPLALRRVLWSGLALGALAVLALSRWLAPAASGLGTHEALGLPPCGFLRCFGWPCPSCGLTTAFAQLARGELGLALRANPVGVPLFALLPLLILRALRAAWRAESAASVLAGHRVDRWALGLVLALLVTWFARLLGRVS